MGELEQNRRQEKPTRGQEPPSGFTGYGLILNSRTTPQVIVQWAHVCLSVCWRHCIYTVEHHAIAYSSVSPGCVTFLCVFLLMCMCMRLSAITIYIWARAYIVNPIVSIRGCCHTTKPAQACRLTSRTSRPQHHSCRLTSSTSTPQHHLFQVHLITSSTFGRR